MCSGVGRRGKIVLGGGLCSLYGQLGQLLPQWLLLGGAACYGGYVYQQSLVPS